MLLFGSPVLVFDNLLDEKYRLELLKESDHLYNTVNGSDHGFYCDVYSTMEDYNLADNDTFNIFHDTLKEKAEVFLHTHGIGGSAEPNHSWLNVYTKGHYQEQHIHERVVVCSVFFLDAPEGSSPLFLHNPFTNTFQFRNLKTEMLLDRRSIKAVSNRLVYFLGWVPHSVPKNKNEDKRYTIATNYGYIEYD